MRPVLFIVAMLGVVVVGTAAAPKEEKPTGVLTRLEKGQTVTLKEVGGRYEIGLVPSVELGHKVVEVGKDYVVVEDLAGVVQTRIPIYSLRAVTVTNVAKK